jgi:hypothetical protein
MLNLLKSINPDKEYPSNMGQRWTDDEEEILLEELSKNIDINVIAQNHNRTVGGINFRRGLIAYKLYSSNNDCFIDDLILKTKLDEDQIIESIQKHQKKNNSKNGRIKNDIINCCIPFSIENEICVIKPNLDEDKLAESIQKTQKKSKNGRCKIDSKTDYMPFSIEN